MSVPTGYQGLRVSVERGEKLGNKTQFAQSGDDNANRLSTTGDREEGGLIEETGYITNSIPPLVSQRDSPDKLVIWGSEQRCIEPQYREFELLECQEIHAFVGNKDQKEEEEEDDDDGGRDEGIMSISSSSTASSASIKVRRNDNDSNRVESRTQRGREAQRGTACRSTEELDCVKTSNEKRDARSGRAEDRERRNGGLKESKSETNVFASSLSAVSLSGSLSSVLDSTNPYPSTNTTTSAQSRRRAVHADADQTSPPSHPQDRQGRPQYFSPDQRQQEGGFQRSGLSYEGGLGQRRKAGFEDRVAPPRRQQLVRPLCQTEVGRARGLAEPSAHRTETGQPSSPRHSPDPHSRGSNLKFTRSALREPSDFSSLYSTSGISQPKPSNPTAQREAPSVEKQPSAAAWHNPSPSNLSTLERRPQTQLTYRRNCSSPSRAAVDSRSSTPPHSPLRTPQGSPRRQPSMFLVSRNTVSGVAQHVPSGCNPAVTTSAKGYGNSCMRAPVKTNLSTSGIPKAPLNNQQSSHHGSIPRESSPSPKLKPKGVRPKIITSVRKNPQFKPQASDGPYQVSSLPSRLTAYSQMPSSFKDPSRDPSKPDTDTRGAPVLSASNLLYDKYRQDMQKNFPSGILSRGIRPPGHTHTVPPAHTHSHTAPPKLASKAENFYGEPPEMGRSSSFKGSGAEDALQARTAAQAGGSASLLRSGRGLRLGLGAVNRTASGSANARGPAQGQRSTLVPSQPVQPVIPATNQKSHDSADDQVFTHHALETAAAAAAAAAAQPKSASSSRSLLPQTSQSGLRAPGFSSSRHPAGRLAAFGFVRSSSVSSASSAHSADSTQSDPCRTAPRPSVSEEPPIHRVTTTSSPPSTDHHHRGPPCRSSSLQPPSTPALPRRYLPAQPRGSPGVGRKQFQRSSEITRSLPSSPKRLAVVPPKPQSPVQSVKRPAAAVQGSATPGAPRQVAPITLLQEQQQESLQREKEEAQQKERERQAEEREKEEQREEVQRLQGRCDQQERQLSALRRELRKTSLGLEAFIITTQQYCLKNESTEENQRILSSEMQMIREEMAFNCARWERLRGEKTALELAFEHELQELQVQQEAELASVEEGLRRCHSAEMEHLRAEHRCEMEELRAQQQEQVEEMTVNRRAATQELRDMHNITMATLHEEHARTMRDLRKAHEQQKRILEEDFDKHRLSLQDQVDTLTFQNQSLRDKAKRFEDALRRSTDEQIIDALAPYQHIEEDLKSLKEVVEMKNQQIHQQEMKISDLEKVAQKNVFLEERVQVLQQQNEDMMARIQMNLTLSRQLSEENANLHESVEKENTEMKRLSRNNEELLWRLQTSPLVSPASSPLHRAFSPSPAPSSPLFTSSSSPPTTACDSPSHCHGCPQQYQAQYRSPIHRGGGAPANRNLSPGPATPTHNRPLGTNQNYSPGPATPTHRVTAAACFNYLQR